MALTMGARLAGDSSAGASRRFVGSSDPPETTRGGRRGNRPKSGGKLQRAQGLR